MTNIDLQYKIVSEEQDLSDYQNNSVISDTPQEINKIKNDCDPCKKNIKERPKLNEAVVKCVNKNLEKRIGKVILPCYDNKIKEEFETEYENIGSEQEMLEYQSNKVDFPDNKSDVLTCTDEMNEKKIKDALTPCKEGTVKEGFINRIGNRFGRRRLRGFVPNINPRRRRGRFFRMSSIRRAVKKASKEAVKKPIKKPVKKSIILKAVKKASRKAVKKPFKKSIDVILNPTVKKAILNIENDKNFKLLKIRYQDTVRKYNKIVKMCDDRFKKYEENIEKLSKKSSYDNVDLQNKLNEYKSKVSEYQNKIANVQKNPQNKKLLDEILKYEKNSISYENKIFKLQKEITVLKKNPSIKEYNKDIKKLENKLNKFNSKYITLQTKYTSSMAVNTAKLNRYSLLLKKVYNEFNLSKELNIKLANKYNTVNTELQECNQKSNDYENDAEKFKKIAAGCAILILILLIYLIFFN